MALFNFKKKKNEEQPTNVITDETSMSEEEAGLTRTFDVETDTIEVKEETNSNVKYTIEETTTNEVVEETDELEELDDDDDYEYVTPHYGRNAIKLTLICIVIGAVVSFVMFKDKMTNEIKNAYMQRGYSLTTSGATATAADIKEGKTAYVLGQLVTGTYVELDTSMATATPADILKGYTAYVNGTKITGIIPTYNGMALITPGTKDIKINKGTYLPEGIIVRGEPNLTSSSIKKGVKIFGVTGKYE